MKLLLVTFSWISSREKGTKQKYLKHLPQILDEIVDCFDLFNLIEELQGFDGLVVFLCLTFFCFRFLRKTVNEQNNF